ncbi:MAG: YrrC family ATP-dependent DNA helicase, partial [Culicoidibacterales bacterium]
MSIGKETVVENFIEGTVEQIRFANEENGYQVVVVHVEQTSEQWQQLLNTDVKVVGALPVVLQVNQQYRFNGSLKHNPTYGEQFDVTEVKKVKKQTKDALIQYLASDLFSGIGKKTAEQLVEQLGENLIDEVLQNISLLDDLPIKGWSSKKAERFFDQLVEHAGSEQALVFLTEHGLSIRQAQSVYQVFGVET